MRENTDQKNSEYGHFLRNGFFPNQDLQFCPYMGKDEWGKNPYFRIIYAVLYFDTPVWSEDDLLQ